MVIALKTPELTEGQRIEISPDYLEEAVYFATKVDRRTESGYVIYAPTTDDYRSNLRVGDGINLRFPWRGAQYVFTSSVISKIHDQVSLLEIEEPVFLKRIQLRDYVRVDARLDIYYRLMIRSNATSDWFDAITADISGGGLCMITAHKHRDLAPGQEVEVRIKLCPKDDEMRLGGIIVRVERLQVTDRNLTSMGLAFTDINERQRSLIIKYVFERQRQLIRMGLTE